MKVQCSCGAKCEFELTPMMATTPIQFVCPCCGLDASEFVDGLVRQELGQAATPSGVPVPVQVTVREGGAAPAPKAVLLESTPSAPAAAIPAAQPARPIARIAGPAPAAAAPMAAGARCLRHPGEIAAEKCYVCSKPICPKCMELFGYVCSPLCKAKAESHGISLPVYALQKSVVEARMWRKVGWVGGSAGFLLLVFLGAWFWYAWFGCLPRTAFSVRFPEPSYSGQSAFAGKDNEQIIFLHGDTLARHDMKLKKAVWSRELVDRNKLTEEAQKEIKDMQERNVKLSDHGVIDVPRIPSMEKLTRELLKDAAAELTLYVRGQNIWVASQGKLARYDWDTGKPVKELTVEPGYGGLISRGDELLVVNVESGKPMVTHLNLATCESTTEELGARAVAALAALTGQGEPGKTGAVAVAKGGKQMAGLPVGTPGKDMGKAMDPAKVAQEAQHMSLPARIALPAVLAGNMNQERALMELNDGQRGVGTGDAAGPRPFVSVIPTKDGFVQFSTRLLEERMVERNAMKAAPAKSALDGNVTVANTLEVANDILNEMQRSRGGDKVVDDLSRYEVTVRKPGSDEVWKGEVEGPPRLYPLQTVNVVTANKLLIVLDKSNHKKWQATLTYNVEGGLGAMDEESATYGQGPCVERKGSLYVFDEGVLSAFDLASGNVRWRLPTVGVVGMFFDDQEMMYVNTTTASPDSIKYSRQIDISQRVGSLVMKVDSKDGKVLWSREPGGLVNHVVGKYIFVVQYYMPPEPDEDSRTIETGFETPPYLRIRRLNPKNGDEIWEHFQQRAPLDIAFEKNTIRLVFKKEVQVLKFMAF